MSGGPWKAVVLDLDGVVTRTAHLHAQAWKQMFDEYLARRSGGERFEPFDIETDYRRYVDGKPRFDGARSFLRSRGIELEEGTPEDPPDRETIGGLGNRKNALFQKLLREKGPEAYPDAVEQLERWRREGLKTALITSSRNGAQVLEATGLRPLFDAVVDGVESARLGIAGKPAPDIFLEAAGRLGVSPGETIVVEDALSGVEAGRAGKFGRVVGVARHGESEALRRHGADVVVDDLRRIDSGGGANGAPPSALDRVDEILERLVGKRLALFLDYDGTLTPIVKRPEDAVLSASVRVLLESLARRATVAIVSGRDLADVQDRVGLVDLAYAGSHGFDITGPAGLRMQHEEAKLCLPELDRAEATLRKGLDEIEGALVERKRFAIAIHYRLVAEEAVVRIEQTVGKVGDAHPKLRRKAGKKIFELQPDVDWHKGRAVQWLIDQLGLAQEGVLPVYIGDDVTDEDAFEALKGTGLGIRVGAPHEPTKADYLLRDVEELEEFFGRLAEKLGTRRPATDREAHPWELIYRRWKPEEQPLREALCALGNGHLVTRGAFEEMSAGGVHYPGTYVAGGYNRLESEVADRIIVNEDLVNWPNWLPLSFRPEGGRWLDLDEVEVLDFEFRLDLQRGLLVRNVVFRDDGDREFSLQTRRLVHIGQPHLAAIEWVLRPLNWSGMLEIRSGLDGDVVNGNVARYRGLNNRHLEVLETGWEGDDGMYLSVRTSQSRVVMTQAARTRVFEQGSPAATRREYEQKGGVVAHRLVVECHQRKSLRVEKVVAIRTSRDFAISEPQSAAREDLRRAPSFEDLLRTHETKWRHLWSISDIELDSGDVQTQLILRLHLFHLAQSTSINSIDRDVGVPARGWHGEAYRGHIFWDELFIFPLLTLRIPEVARSLLMYRYRRLDRARHLAREAGYEGAMFPWQSGSDGREESQVLHLNPKSGRWLPDTTHLQRHVNAAIAYSVWEYYQSTGDHEFLAYYGAEMLLEIARFWASIATYDATVDRFVIEGVVGPDEFHTDDPRAAKPGLRNNAYTNVMAAWCLRCACVALSLLERERREKLKGQLSLSDEEQVRWHQVSRRLLVPFHGDGIISQFEGYEQLEEFDWETYRRKYGEAMRLDRILEAEGDDVNRYKASKQADVLMLFFLFSLPELEELFGHMGYQFDQETLDRNIDYYMARTAHGSTLSQVVHSWVLARRDRKRAWALWQQALRSDIDDVQGGTTPEGIHLGAMASTVDLIFRGHTGLVFEEDTLWLNPQIPEELADVKFRIRYRGHWLTLLITQDSCTVSFDRGRLPAVQVGFRGEVVRMEQGETRTFRMR